MMALLQVGEIGLLTNKEVKMFLTKTKDGFRLWFGDKPMPYKMVVDTTTLRCTKCPTGLDVEISGRKAGDEHSCGGTLYHPKTRQTIKP